MTPHSDCNKLDAYLADDLPGEDTAVFESHLEACAECREAIDEQKWIDDLLQSSARLRIERPAAAFLDSFHSSLSQRRPRIWQAAYGLATAAALIIAIGWLTLDRRTDRPSISNKQDVAVTEAVRATAPGKPQATFVTSTDAIVVPLESPSTDVTIVQVYQTTETERRWRLEQSLVSALAKSNGG